MRPKPAELYYRFLKASAIEIQSSLNFTKLQMTHHRVLRSVYKAAWQEKASVCAHGDNPLRWSSDFRSAAWWKAILVMISSNTRRADGLSHAQRGCQVTSWEHPFVAFFGTHWREKLHNCSSLSEWMQGCEGFVNSLCEIWGLPKLRVAGPAPIFDPHHERLVVHIGSPPEICKHALDKEWQSPGKRLWIQVDCKAVAELLAGRAVLYGNIMAPIFTPIARLIVKLVGLGWRPLIFSGFYYMVSAGIQYGCRPCSQCST